jgi:hypothetical protein
LQESKAYRENRVFQAFRVRRAHRASKGFLEPLARTVKLAKQANLDLVEPKELKARRVQREIRAQREIRVRLVQKVLKVPLENRQY